LATVEYTVVIPATLRDPTSEEDITACPIGPLVSTPEGITRMNGGACEKLIDGQPQGPGSFTEKCIQSLFLSSGCTTDGKSYPNNFDRLNKLTKNENTGDNLEIDEINSKISEIHTVATTGTDENGNTYEEKAVAKYNIDCFGKSMSNPCDTPFKDAGPHTPQCLDYLFRNAGADNSKIGQTYVGVKNRSSGTRTSEKNPVMYCQRAGSMSPIGKDGKFNYDAIKKANSKGGINAVKEFYRQIHYDANYNKDIEPQKKGLNQCYGITTTPKPPLCPKKTMPSCSNSFLPGNVSLLRGNNIGNVTHNGNYKLTFKINVKAIVASDWGSILHFTKTGKDCCDFGDRGPGIWFFPGETRMYVILGDTSNGDWQFPNTNLVAPVGQESVFTLICDGKSISISLNSQQFTATQPGTRPAGNFTVYSGCPWYSSANAEIRDLCFTPL
jgi:hypothetical protein